MSVNMVQRSGGRGDSIPQIGRLPFCDECGGRDHEAVYSHEGQYGDGAIYAVVCPADGLTGYYTLEVVVIPLVEGVTP